MTQTNNPVSELSQTTLRRGEQLLKSGLITGEKVEEVNQVGEVFSVAISPNMTALIDPKNMEDPIARQFVPTLEELNVLPEELLDPIGDDPHTAKKGVTHRYPDRLLLKPLHTCAVYCRFCFRREKVGPGNESLSQQELDRALNYIQSRSEVWEVILSGGDPMILTSKRLAYIMDALNDIDHVEVVRIHTRVPVVSPEKVTTELVKALSIDKPVYVVVHCNHPRELNEPASQACKMLVEAGIVLLSQSVLLKGVNDDIETMSQLMRKLVKNRIKPYYLHHGDLAQGTSHFRTSIEEGQNLMRAMRGHVSGICQPQYILDIPGGYGKVPIGPNYLTQTEDGYIVEDYVSNKHQYPPQADS